MSDVSKPRGEDPEIVARRYARHLHVMREFRRAWSQGWDWRGMVDLDFEAFARMDGIDGVIVVASANERALARVVRRPGSPSLPVGWRSGEDRVHWQRWWVLLDALSTPDADGIQDEVGFMPELWCVLPDLAL